jgi:hypothetical protein
MWQVLKPLVLFVVIGGSFSALLTMLVVWFERRPIKARPSQMRLITHTGWRPATSGRVRDEDLAVPRVRVKETVRISRRADDPQSDCRA